MKRSALLALACLAAPLLAIGCKPKVGANCKIETTEVCVGDKQALVCHDAKWTEMACRGPSGCAKAGSEYFCDQSVVEDKDVCNLANDFVCASDKKGMLECRGNKWTFVQACLGSRGCAMEGKKVLCDDSVANLGDACREDDDYACSADGKNALVCRGKKIALVSSCKGKNGCRVVGDKNAGSKIECDDSIAGLGDPCDKEGHYSCAPDERSIVRCVGKKFVQDDKCKPKEKCGVKGEQVGCY